MKTLTIRLSAPLQAYGDQASFARRTTNPYPTKSAIIGMIAAAFGYRRTDPRIQALNQLAFAVRVDQPGSVLSEFQTVEWKPNTRKITYRDYLQDAVFVAAIGGDTAEIEQIAAALKKPQFQLYLGRRAAVPAVVLKMQQFADTDPVTVLQQLEWQASLWFQQRHRKQATYSAELYADHQLIPAKGTQLVKDRVLSFDQRARQHGFRAIAQTRVTLANAQYRAPEVGTDHDAWTAI
ncbi:type I-E CRISPR-associated protein Cas5/CasD [Lacticaseibacillus baoqingensis]|uniref:Type I-E CRISPR-associated protein Cas5/CasD n=1 Tax=Lacticaseibacillus baoqingensis TaxID=2486013 RepID=A0ABW4EA32_9LACO|nr:type I-E CRISPR-associated protein Cas5/CasD [Lacticaseibacillus baoqingensis]